MGLKSKLMAGATSLLATTMMFASNVAAQYDSYSSYSGSSDGDVAGIFGGTIGLILTCCFGIFWIVIMVMYIMSLVHCVQNAPEDKKTMWILLILFVPFAALIYFFTKRNQWKNGQVIA
jgi:hypothetical protein